MTNQENKQNLINLARAAARTWVANLEQHTKRYGRDLAWSPYTAADLCGYAGGFSDGRERAAFIEEFIITRELQEATAGRPNAVEFLRVTHRCESGWTGDRCQLPLGHDGPHDNE